MREGGEGVKGGAVLLYAALIRGHDCGRVFSSGAIVQSRQKSSYSSRFPPPPPRQARNSRVINTTIDGPPAHQEAFGEAVGKSTFTLCFVP